MSKPLKCVCGHWQTHHGPTGRCEVNRYYVQASCLCEGFRELEGDGKQNRDNIDPELLRFAEWQIKMHLRIVDSIREKYGLKA